MSDLPDSRDGTYAFAKKTDRLFSEPLSPKDVGSVVEDVALTIQDFVLDEDLVNNALYLLLRYTQHLETRLAAAERSIAVLEGPDNV